MRQPSNRPRVIAEHEFTWKSKSIHARLFAPRPVSGGGYICTIEIDGLTPEGRVCASGIDSMQSLVRALASFVAILAERRLFPIDDAGRDSSHELQPILLATEFLGDSMKRQLYDRITSAQFVSKKRTTTPARRQSSGRR